MLVMSYGETPPGLASQILNLAKLLTRRAALRVPRYQRPFTWTEREVRQLIQDLWRAYKRDATFYFIGQIVLVKNERGELEISDGQQRMTVLTMIIAYVRDRIPARAQHYQGLVMDGGKPRLLLRAADSSFFWGNVQEPNNMKRMARLEETGYDSRDLMVAAAATIESELARIGNAELDNFISFVVRCATFNVVEADERGAAAGIYNAMNNTGQDLSAADNIKGDLLENSGLGDQDAETAALKWEELENGLGREDFAALINMMPFLLTGAPLISPGDLGAFRAKVEAAGGVKGFLFDRLPRYGEALRDILRAEVKLGAASEDVNRRIKILLQLGETRWLPAALVFVAEYSGLDPDQAFRFFRALERFTFGCELAVIDNTVREDRFALAMKRAGDDAVYLKDGPLDLSDAEKLAFIERLNRSSKSDRQRKMMLIRVEASLPGGSVLPRRSDITVEHVLPTGNAPWWHERFPDRVMRQEYANMLGNMVLISRKQNVRADCKPYPDKWKIYFQTPGAPVHAITRGIESITDWSAEVIETRHERIVHLLCADWDIVPSEHAR
ncbi:MAG TPA: DUF262 domain-containing HNH endonuclease family protein [Caulobacterales bacterium]|nr:DUF262 domain-containing HNH endonuclease family protein [Caulobacterales bacterium]